MVILSLRHFSLAMSTLAPLLDPFKPSIGPMLDKTGPLGPTSPLAWEILDGDIERVKAFIANYKSMSLRSQALQLAAKGGQLECVKLLIPFANPSSNDSLALRCAAQRGHLECVKLLIPVSDPSGDDASALVLAAECGSHECVSALLPFCGELANISLALEMAAKSGSKKCLELLIPLLRGQSSNALDSAARFGHIECVELLIAVEETLPCAPQALVSAASEGHAACVELLTGVCSSQYYLSWALFCAAGSGHAECVKLLIPFVKLSDIRGHALVKAAESGNGECVKLMLAASGSNPEGVALALLGAVKENQLECLQILLEPLGNLAVANRFWPPKAALHFFAQQRAIDRALAESVLCGLPNCSQAIALHATANGIFQAIKDASLATNICVSSTLSAGRLASIQDLIPLVPDNKLRRIRRLMAASWPDAAMATASLDALIEKKCLLDEVACPKQEAIHSRRARL